MTTEGPDHDCPGTSTRRSFLFKFGVAVNAVAGALVAVPVLGYLLSPARRKAWQAWISLGTVDEYPEHETRLAQYENPFTVPWEVRTAGKIPCWVRRIEGEEFQVFAINCAHLGCPVRWFRESKLFMCPCHGGVYYEDGAHASGPPPRGLFEYEYKVENGELLVRGGRLPTLHESV